MDNITNFERNDDITDILSETYSNTSGSPSMRVNKVDSRQTRPADITARMAATSSKDIGVGLDLLINKDKRKHIDPLAATSRGASNTRKGFNLKETTDDSQMVNDMLSNLDLDTTSRLSQQDIDRLIDDSDRNTVLDGKSTLESVSLNSRSGNNVDTSSVLQSRHSRRTPRVSSEESRRKKQEILFKLEKMRRLGIVGIKKFNMSNNLEDMESELARVKYERELESSVKFQRKCLMAFVTGTELVNNKFDFLDLKLDGWSEQVHDGIDEYNEVFEELHEKYQSKVKMAPEIKLLFMLGGGAFMYHLTNSMFKNSIPGMEDIMKQNPDLMKQFASAAINQMQGEERQAAEIFNSFQPGQQQSSRQQQPQSFNQSAPRSPIPNRSFRDMPRNGVTSNTGYVESSSSLPMANKISPPVGVDDILQELQSHSSDVEDLLSETSSRKVNIKRKRRKGGKRGISLNIE